MGSSSDQTGTHVLYYVSSAGGSANPGEAAGVRGCPPAAGTSSALIVLWEGEGDSICPFHHFYTLPMAQFVEGLGNMWVVSHASSCSPSPVPTAFEACPARRLTDYLSSPRLRVAQVRCHLPTTSSGIRPRGRWLCPLLVPYPWRIR